MTERVRPAAVSTAAPHTHFQHYGAGLVSLLLASRAASCRWRPTDRHSAASNSADRARLCRHRMPPDCNQGQLNRAVDGLSCNGMLGGWLGDPLERIDELVEVSDRGQTVGIAERSMIENLSRRLKRGSESSSGK